MVHRINHLQGYSDFRSPLEISFLALMNPTLILSITCSKGPNDIQQSTRAISLGFAVTLIAKSDLVKAADAAFDSCLEFNSSWKNLSVGCIQSIFQYSE